MKYRYSILLGNFAYRYDYGTFNKNLSIVVMKNQQKLEEWDTYNRINK